MIVWGLSIALAVTVFNVVVRVGDMWIVGVEAYQRARTE